MAKSTDPWMDFMVAYEGSDSTKEVAEKLNLTTTTVTSKAARLRKDGVPLKRFSRAKGGAEIKVDDLQAALAKLRKTTVQKIKADAKKTQAEVAKNAKALAEKTGGKKRGRPSKKK